MSRSLKKGPVVDEKLFRRAEAMQQLAEAEAARARGDDELRLRRRRLRGAAAA